MTEENHNIPEWYIPDEEQVIANEPETEEIEEEGELDEPLCPHCGEPYEKYEDRGSGWYVHKYAVEWSDWDYHAGGRSRHGKNVEIAVWCDGSGEKKTNPEAYT